MENDLSGEQTGNNGRHPLPDLDVLADKLRALGLRDDMQVVAYDDAAGAMAGRVWWLLRELGFAHVAVLDGGIGAWKKCGLSLNADLPSPRKGTLTRKPSLNHTVTANEILAQLPIGTFTLVDARAPERYRGEVEPLDPVAGHIPTACNQFMMNNVDEHGYFKSPEVLRAQWMELLGDAPIHSVINYCGSGVTACHNVLSMHIAGLDVSNTGAGIYAGSWSEWCADSTRPMSKRA
jgi:thiosulfate/3-mercaptopyruvate sulfurtransferase